MARKDWLAGITDEEAKEDRAKYAKAKEDITEINALLDELFPEEEEERKPETPPVHQGQQRWG